LRKPPEGRARWTLELLAGAMVNLTDHDSLSGETVRRRLAENGLKPWRKDMWCIPKSTANMSPHGRRARPLLPRRRPTRRWSASTKARPTDRRGTPADPAERVNSNVTTASIAATAPSISRLHRREQALAQVKVTSAAAEDYAQCMRELVDVHYPEAACIRSLQDNLSTHSAAPSMKHSRPRSPADSATPGVPLHPKHASWLNMSRSRSAYSAASAWTVGSTTQAPDLRNRRMEKQRNAASAASMDVHDRKSPRQNGPRLSVTSKES